MRSSVAAEVRWSGRPSPRLGRRRRRRSRLVADLPGDLAAEDGVLVPEHEQFGILGGVMSEQHRRGRQQSTGQLVQQRHDHRIMISTPNAYLAV